MVKKRRRPTPPRGSDITWIGEDAPGPAGDLLAALPDGLKNAGLSVLEQSRDLISGRVNDLCELAGTLGRRFGVHGDPYALEAAPSEVVAAITGAFQSTSRFFQLTRTSSVDWGIFHLEEPGLLAASRGARESARPLPGCGIEIRRAFLRICPEFFRRYFEKVAASIGDARDEISVADDVIRQLRLLVS